MFATFRLECFGAGGDPPKLCEEAKKKTKTKKQKQTRSLIFLYRATTKTSIINNHGRGTKKTNRTVDGKRKRIADTAKRS